MKKQIIKINIEDPCNENWANMLPTEQGKHCLACAKTVVDFSTMTNAEIINYLSVQNDSVCGRISKYQLNIPLANYIPIKNNFFNKYVAGLLMAIGFYSTGVSQTSDDQRIEINQAQKEKKQNPSKKDSIKGKIICKETHKAIPLATIKLVGTDISVQSNKKGEYTLVLPKNFEDKIIQLQFICDGYLIKDITNFTFVKGVAIVDISLSSELHAAPEQIMMGKIAPTRVR